MAGERRRESCGVDRQETDVMWVALNAVTLCDAIIQPRTSTDSDVRSHNGVEGGGGSDEEPRYGLGDISTPQEWHLLATEYGDASELKNESG